jgi:hypothetical protein
MSSPITNKHIKNIAQLIREWSIDENLTWDAICKEAELIIGYVPTRQALSKKPLLTNAYKSRKAEIKARFDTLSTVPTPKSMSAAVDQIIRLKQENERLKTELNMMAETAQRFIHNASLHGLTPAQLMKPLPSENRRD